MPAFDGVLAGEMRLTADAGVVDRQVEAARRPSTSTD